MTTKTQDIVAAIASILAVAGLTVRDDTEELYSFENQPVVVVDVGDESPDPVFGSGLMYWNVTVSLLIGADGAIPKLAPEATRASAHAALFADRTLGVTGVVDIVAAAVKRSIDAENPARGITQVDYIVKYRISEAIV